MADDPATLSNQIQSLPQDADKLTAALNGLKSASDAVSSAMKNLGKDGSRSLQDLGEETNDVSSIFEHLSDISTKFFDNMQNKSAQAARFLIAQFGQDFFGKTKEEAELTSTAIAEEFKDMGKSIVQIFGGVGGFLEQNKIDLSKYIVVGAGLKIAEGAITKGLGTAFVGFDKDITGKIRSVLPLVTSFSGALEGVGGEARPLGEAVSESLGQISQAMQDTGRGFETLEQNAQVLSQAGLSIGDFGSLMLSSTAEGTKGIKGMTAAIDIAAATGMGLRSVADTMQLGLKSLGKEGSEVSEMFAAISLAQEGSRLSFEDVHKAIVDQAGAMRFYGDTTEQLSVTFNGFIRALGRGKEELAKDLFTKSIQGIQNLNMGLKAYLGLQSQIGQGRGAIGAGLEFEEAIAKGDFGQIFDSIQGQLQKFTGGGPVLTRQQALETGQEQQYLTQRQLLGQFTGVTDAGQADTLMKALQSGNLTQFKQTFEPERLARAEETLGARGGEAVRAEVGVTEGLLNRARAEQVDALSKMTDSYLDVGGIFAEQAEQIRQNLTIVTGTAREYLSDKKKAADKVVTTAEKGDINVPISLIETETKRAQMGVVTAPELNRKTITDQLGTITAPETQRHGLLQQMNVTTTKDLQQDRFKLFKSANDLQLSPPDINLGPNISKQEPSSSVIQEPLAPIAPSFIKATEDLFGAGISPTRSMPTDMLIKNNSNNKNTLNVSSRDDMSGNGQVVAPQLRADAQPQTIEAIVKFTVDNGSLNASISKVMNNKISKALSDSGSSA